MKRGVRRLVRLRSASSQLPDGYQPKRWFRCPQVTGFLKYTFMTILVVTVLMLNNIALLYFNNIPGRSTIDGTPYTVNLAPERVPGSWDYTSEKTDSRGTQNDLPDPFPKWQKVKHSDEKSKVGKEKPASSHVTSSSAAHTPVTPNEILKQSMIIVTSTRTSCKSFEILNKFVIDYPDLPIFTSLNDNTRKACINSSVTCVRVPQSCQGACEDNKLLTAVTEEEKGYVFIWNAGFDNTDHLVLVHLAKKWAHSSHAHLIAPCETHSCSGVSGLLHQSSDGVLTALPGLNLPPVDQEEHCQKSNLFPPTFLTTLKLLKTNRWSEAIASGHHLDFLLTLKNNKLTTFICKDIQVAYNGFCKASNSSSKDWLHLPPVAFKKWKVNTFYTGSGDKLELVSDNVRRITEKWHSLMPHSYLSSYLLDAVMQAHNDKSSGWTNMRLKDNSNSTKLDYLLTSPCVYHIRGKVHVEYDRHSSFNNKEFHLDVDTFHLNRSCNMFNDYWSSSKYGKLPRKHIYYITAVSNDTEFMARLLDQLNKQTQRSYTHLVVVDMGRPGPEQFNVSQHKSLIDTHYLWLGAPFSRSIGLRKGFDFAQKIAQQNSHDDPILFSMDTSMLLPKNFTKRVWKSTRCGVSSYAPICYKEKLEGGGFWVQYGYGMIGACASDYRQSGGWDPKWGYHWGAEDVDLMHKLQSTLSYTVRVREEKYVHKHNEASREHSKEYYKNKNVYPGELPVTPQSRLVTDKTLIKSLTNYALKIMKYSNIKLTLHTIYQTAVPGQGLLYDLRFHNDIHEDYYALVQSV